MTHHISDHFMNFCIVGCKIKKRPIPNKYIEVENVNPKSIANLKNFVAKSELISQLDNNPYIIIIIIIISLFTHSNTVMQY